MPPSPDRHVAHLAGRQHGTFSRRQALERGVTPKAIRGRLELGLWIRLHRGVYALAGSPATWHRELAAACLASDGHASHRAAAGLFGLLPEGAVEVVVPKGTRRTRAGIVVHEAADLRPGDLVDVASVPATSVVRTLVDIAAVLDEESFDEVLDSALTRRLTTLDRLRRRAQHVRGHGRRGAALLRRALERRDGAGPESPLERRFLRLLEAGGFTSFRPQVAVEAAGRRFRLDFADLEHGVALEVDGRHHAGLRQWHDDLRRQNLLVSTGLTVLRFTEADLADPEAVWSQIEAVLARVEAP